MAEMGCCKQERRPVKAIHVRENELKGLDLQCFSMPYNKDVYVIIRMLRHRQQEYSLS